MRQEQVKPKVARQVTLPEDLKAFFRHAVALIDAYNSQPNLGKRLGWFNLEEIERIIAEDES